jgi:hypothetical protein
VSRGANQWRGLRRQVEIALASLKGVFCLGETLAATLTGLATRIAAKIIAYTYGLLYLRNPLRHEYKRCKRDQEEAWNVQR